MIIVRSFRYVESVRTLYRLQFYRVKSFANDFGDKNTWERKAHKDKSHMIYTTIIPILMFVCSSLSVAFDWLIRFLSIKLLFKIP